MGLFLTLALHHSGALGATLGLVCNDGAVTVANDGVSFIRGKLVQLLFAFGQDGFNFPRMGINEGKRYKNSKEKRSGVDWKDHSCARNESCCG